MLRIDLELTDKTILVHFNKNKIASGNTEIKIGIRSIESGETTRFLRIIFDYRLTFSQQLNNVIKKCSKALRISKVSLRYLVKQ